jgi:hypothetical protein
MLRAGPRSLQKGFRLSSEQGLDREQSCSCEKQNEEISVQHLDNCSDAFSVLLAVAFTFEMNIDFRPGWFVS